MRVWCSASGAACLIAAMHAVHMLPTAEHLMEQLGVCVGEYRKGWAMTGRGQQSGAALYSTHLACIFFCLH